MIIGLLLACVATQAPDTGTPAGSDSGAPPQTTAGWSLGGVQACDQPTATPGWVDDSDRLGVDSIPPETPTTSLSVARQGSDWMVAIVQVPDRVRWWTLEEGTEGAWLFDAAPLRATLVDLDADGRLDLVGWGDQLHVGWAIGTDDERWEQLWHREEVCMGVQEMVIFDADGDGDLDILQGASQGCDDAVGPTLIRQGPAGVLVADPGTPGRALGRGLLHHRAGLGGRRRPRCLPVQ